MYGQEEHTMYKTLVPAFIVAGLLSACGTTTTTKPTHWWSAEAPVSRVIYTRDNSACEEASGLTGAGDAASESYTDYHRCMRQAGYTLISSNDT